MPTRKRRREHKAFRKCAATINFGRKNTAFADHLRKFDANLTETLLLAQPHQTPGCEQERMEEGMSRHDRGVELWFDEFIESSGIDLVGLIFNSLVCPLDLSFHESVRGIVSKD